MDRYQVTGMSCAACSARVEKAVLKVPGVTECSVSLLTNSMGVTGSASPEEIIKAVEKAGYGASRMETGSPSRAGRKSGTLAESGTGQASGQTASQMAGQTTGQTTSHTAGRAQEDMLEDRTTPALVRRLLSSIGFLLVLMYISMGHMMWGWPLPAFLADNHVAMGLTEMLLTIIIMVINQRFFISGVRSLLHGAPNMDTLVAMGSGAAFCYSTYALYAMTAAQKNGDLAGVMQYMDEFYFESAAMILTLITVGKMLESHSKGKTTDALKGLMRLSPKTAVLLRDGEETEVPIGEVEKGDLFVVRPGETIPVDGIVVTGSSAVNEAALTGESIPVDKEAESRVSAGTMNQSGFLTCRASRVGEDTTLSQIIRMVSDAAATKAPIAKTADRISGIFVPAVMAVALVTFAVWLLLGKEVGFALARGISVLVISCPCALGLATPVAIMVGNGVGARNGILFKTAVSLEETGRTQIVVLDKTGTITKGEPQVTDVLPAKGIEEEQLLFTSFLLEQKSEHPLAKAVVAYGEERQITERISKEDEKTGSAGFPGQSEVTGSTGSFGQNGVTGSAGSSGHQGQSEVTGFRALPGNGVAGWIDGAECFGGSLSYVQSRITLPKEVRKQADDLAKQGKTPLLFAREECFLGMIAVADTVKEDSAKAVSELKDMGIRVVMLTGDNEQTARSIADTVGVDRVIAGVLPDGKEAVIRTLQEQGKVAMVGDGINDAPALTQADVGIAIGAGTDVAIDAADVVLIKSRLSDAAAAIRLSRATLRNIHENLFWAFFYNVIGIPLAAGVWIPLFHWQLNPMFGAAAMSLSSFCVVMNALRLNFIRMHPAEKKHNNSKEETKMTKTLKIKGMMCPHCEAAVKKGLEALPEVEEAQVSHTEGTAVLTLNAEISDEALKKTVEELGYQVL